MSSIEAEQRQRLTLVKALNLAMEAEMAADPRVLVMGEDVGRLGGVFRVTDGLLERFGPQRVLDTPLAESGIVGCAVGLALRGFRPIVEIQFNGFVYPAFNQIVTQVARQRLRSCGVMSVPLVIRIPHGGNIGAVEHHMESPEAYFAHTPGLRVVSCATPSDAYWMLRQAVQLPDPVIFFEPLSRYWPKAEVDLSTSLLPLDRAAVVRPGRDVTLIGHGAMVHNMLAAADLAAAEGRSLEVIDLRSLAPVDYDTVLESVVRTGRAVVCQEAPGSVSVGSEVAATIAEQAFYYLEAPVLRVSGYDIPFPVAALEHNYIPDADRILEAVDHVASY